MSKTHWLAILQVILTAVTQLGYIDDTVANALQTLLGVGLTGTLVHRGVKIATGTTA